MHDGQTISEPEPGSALLPEALALTTAALGPVEDLLDQANAVVGPLVRKDGRISASLMEAHQTLAHGLAWVATYAEALRQLQGWALRLDADGRFGEMERLILQIGFGEYLDQLAGGIPMSQLEFIRPRDFGLSADALDHGPAQALRRHGNTQEARSRLVELMRQAAGAVTFGQVGLDDELDMIRDQFYRFSEAEIRPQAHGWHLDDRLIPMEILDQLAEMGVFGLTIPEEFGGFGLGKLAMCVVSEELSRGFLGVGSLGTRSEIAAELILCGGTETQKAHWLPKLASGEILPTAVFTEPNTGSDLGALRTRAVREGDDWSVTGNKTWITHAARAHLWRIARWRRCCPTCVSRSPPGRLRCNRLPGNGRHFGESLGIDEELPAERECGARLGR